MNKKQFIAAELKKNERVFGRWGSPDKPNSASRLALLYCGSPTNEEEVLQHANALVSDGHMLCTDPCHNIGISGGCGLECFVYLKGECDEPDAMIEGLEGEEIVRHIELYWKPTTNNRR